MARSKKPSISVMAPPPPGADIQAIANWAHSQFAILAAAIAAASVDKKALDEAETAARRAAAAAVAAQAAADTASASVVSAKALAAKPVEGLQEALDRLDQLEAGLAAVNTRVSMSDEIANELKGALAKLPSSQAEKPGIIKRLRSWLARKLQP